MDRSCLRPTCGACRGTRAACRPSTKRKSISLLIAIAGVNRSGADADADHDDAGEQRRALDDALDHAGRADALEHDGVLGPRAERLAQPPGVPPADRQPFELLARADRQLERGRRVGEMVVLRRRPCKARPRRDRRRCRLRTPLAKARRPGEKSAATTVCTPFALRQRITPSPTGPQPITIATVRFRTSPRRTACQATAIGSVSAATSPEARWERASSATPGRGPARRRHPARAADKPIGSMPLRPAQQRQCDDGRSGRHVLAAGGTVLGDRAGELVAEDDRLVGPAEALVADLLGRCRPSGRGRGGHGGRNRRFRSATPPGEPAPSPGVASGPSATANAACCADD